VGRGGTCKARGADAKTSGSCTKIWYPLNKRCLTRNEIIQQKLLWKRNAMNDCVITGSKVVVSNAKLIAEAGAIDCPVILFVSDGKQVTKNWIEHEREFAKMTNAEYVQLNCGHYVHYYESDRIKNEIIRFVNGL
jgi:predicted metal-binding transcription factor (methanogenesis marker protein 9)